MSRIESPLYACLIFGDSFELIDGLVEETSCSSSELLFIIEQLDKFRNIVDFGQIMSNIVIFNKNGQGIFAQVDQTLSVVVVF